MIGKRIFGMRYLIVRHLAALGAECCALSSRHKTSTVKPVKAQFIFMGSDTFRKEYFFRDKNIFQLLWLLSVTEAVKKHEDARISFPDDQLRAPLYRVRAAASPQP